MSYCPPSAVQPVCERSCAASGLRWYKRVAVIVAGSVLASLLVTAAVLRPNPNGMGTHRQLGLPPCTAVMLLGIRCPSCGMTTSWSHTMRGNVLAALEANCGGTLLALVSLVAAPWLVASGFWGRWAVVAPKDWVLLTICLTIIVVTLVDWCVRLNFS